MTNTHTAAAIKERSNLLLYHKCKKADCQLELHSKGQFFKNTVYLKRGMPYFAFVGTNAVLVRKIDKA